MAEWQTRYFEGVVILDRVSSSLTSRTIPSSFFIFKFICGCGGTGRRAGLKILLWQHSTGSIPVAGITL